MADLVMEPTTGSSKSKGRPIKLDSAKKFVDEDPEGRGNLISYMREKGYLPASGGRGKKVGSMTQILPQTTLMEDGRVGLDLVSNPGNVQFLFVSEDGSESDTPIDEFRENFLKFPRAKWVRKTGKGGKPNPASKFEGYIDPSNPSGPSLHKGHMGHWWTDLEQFRKICVQCNALVPQKFINIPDGWNDTLSDSERETLQQIVEEFED